MDRLPDDLKDWQDALDDRDLAKQAYESYKGKDMRIAAVLCEVLISAGNRVEKLRKEHYEPFQGSTEIESRDESELGELVTPYLTSEDEYHDNRERGRNIR